jgi:carbon monoxide dehydrogenase subunit G
MRVSAQIDVSASRETIWGFITDPARALHFLAGVTRWEVAGDADRGLGARYRMLMRVGSAEIGSLVEIVEYDEPCDMAWTSVTGLDQRGRWRLRERNPGSQSPRTRVEFRLAYGVAGAGITGWVAERVAAPQVRDNLRRSLQQLKRQVEHEELRSAAAERRAAKARA